MIEDEQILDAKVLIIDDDAQSVKLLRDIFQKDGYRYVTSINDSRQATQMYQELNPDLIVLDLSMPEVDGFEVMQRLKEVDPDTYLPICILTKEAEQSVRFKALESGAKDFLNKPYDRVEVMIRFRNLIEVRMLHNEVKEQNKMLEDKVKARTKELYDTQIDVITRLARAIEYRDSETGLHILRMSHYSARLAAEAGCSMQYCEMVLTAAPLHDIGKIGIPDKILQKSGRLSEEEWEIMKTHTTIGAELLSGSNSKFLNIAREIALTHHEHWDGAGYPNGLKGEEIPLIGRICGLTDVFDALMATRPYKRPWTFEQTIDEIKSGDGSHFDPRLVEKFLSILPDIQYIRDKYVDPQSSDSI